MDHSLFEEQLAKLPLYGYFEIDPAELEFDQRVRHICQTECPMYGQTWACPPGVGAVEDCREKCLSYNRCLMIVTVTEVQDITNIDECLATRPGHEKITNQVRDLMGEQGVVPYILSTEACCICDRCAYLDGLPCRLPGKMHPCVESHGIVLIPTAEKYGIEFQYGQNIVTWFSLLFYQE